jgi:predicted nucleic acid-binding protein
VIFITRHYFPDTNILLYYITKYEIRENSQIEKLIQATEKKSLEGVICPSVAGEFDKILNNTSISEAQSIANSLIQNCNNSKPKLTSELDKFHSAIRSEELVIKELKFLVETEKSFSTISAMQKLFELSRAFKIRKNKLTQILKKIDSTSISQYAVKFCEEVEKIKADFKKLFPIKKPNDEVDNMHIINSALCCKLHNMNGTFITDDNLRAKSGTEFLNNCKNAKKCIENELGVTLYIEKLEKYCKFKNLF